MTEVAKLVLKTNRLLLTGRGFHIRGECKHLNCCSAQMQKKYKSWFHVHFLTLDTVRGMLKSLPPCSLKPQGGEPLRVTEYVFIPLRKEKKKKRGKGNILISQKARKRFSRSFIILLYLKQSICWLSAPPAHKSTHTHSIQKITLKLFSFTADNVTS